MLTTMLRKFLESPRFEVFIILMHFLAAGMHLGASVLMWLHTPIV